MSHPIFRPSDVQEIREASMGDSEIISISGDAWLLRMLRPVADLGLNVGDRIVAVRQRDVPDGQVAIVYRDRHHLVRRAPVGEGTIVGLAIGRVEEITDAA